MDVFHAGERFVQNLVAAGKPDDSLGAMIQPVIPTYFKRLSRRKT